MILYELIKTFLIILKKLLHYLPLFNFYIDKLNKNSKNK